MEQAPDHETDRCRASPITQSASPGGAEHWGSRAGLDAESAAEGTGVHRGRLVASWRRGSARWAL